MIATVIIGSNEFTNTEALLTIDGVQVFRLREPSNNQLVADFTIPDEHGNTLVKVAGDNIVYARPGADLQVRNAETYSEVVDIYTGAVIARAEEESFRTIRLTGTFRLKPPVVMATHDTLIIGGLVLAGTRFYGGNGIVIDGYDIRVG